MVIGGGTIKDDTCALARWLTRLSEALDMPRMSACRSPQPYLLSVDQSYCSQELHFLWVYRAQAVQAETSS